LVNDEWDTAPIDIGELKWREACDSAGVRAFSAPDGAWATRLGVLVWLGGIVAVALVAPTVTAHDLTAPGGMATFAGRVTGMAGTYLLLVSVLLIGRLPAIEQALGRDALVRWHRRLGPWVLGLLLAHGLLITVGYAQGLSTGPLHELWVLVVRFPGMLGAVAGLGLIVLVGVTSYRNVRRHMRYETWWTVHLYAYVAAAVAFSHQLATGTPFIGHPLARAYWITLWLLTLGVVLCFRVGLPLVRSASHRIRVARVEEEAPGVVSVVMRGRRLDRLAVAGGQFLTFRFLARGMWWHGHPYSLSALPGRREMRITVKAAGEHSSALAELRPGTRVVVEGPYGSFVQRSCDNSRVLLVAAGVGVTPVRAMLEDLPPGVNVVVILRGSSERDLVLRDEVRRLVDDRGGRLHEVVGPRAQRPLDAPHLYRMVPDIAQRDLYVCGPSGFMEHLIREAHSLGVPPERIHREDFTF
jgi:ferredoxin-NADP reductase